MNKSGLNLFCAREEDLFKLYLSDVSTIKCLSCLTNTSITIIEFGATLFRQYGWATKQELPELKTVKELLSFLIQEYDIGLIELKIVMDNIGYLSTYDDREVHLVFKTKALCIAFLKEILPHQSHSLIIHNLLNNSGAYISWDGSLKINKYYL